MEANFAEHAFQDHVENSMANMRALATGGKRKRDSFDHGAATGAPNSRKAASSTYPDNSLPAPTANMSEATTEYMNQHHSQEQFDLSALQSHPTDESNLQPQGGDRYGQNINGGGNVDTATAALRQHYNLDHPSEGFLPESNPTVDDAGGYNLEGAHAVQPDIAGLDGPAGDLDPVSDEGGNGAGGNKPNVGTEEWHKVRKDNHKEGTISHVS